MLKYLILSTPRCGSSTIMACAERVLGAGTFVREPLNPYEDPSHHPSILHGMTIAERTAALLDPRCPIRGVKHVHSPFNQRMKGEDGALRAILSIKGLRVILLSRRNVPQQFISMEIALQSGDWWSSGPAALPDVLGPIKAGGDKPLDDDAIAMRLEHLENAAEWLRQLCRATNARYIERTYEDLFCADPAAAARGISAALAHFTPVPEKLANGLVGLISRGQRFREIDNLYNQVGRIYRSLRTMDDPAPISSGGFSR